MMAGAVAAYSTSILVEEETAYRERIEAEPPLGVSHRQPVSVRRLRARVVIPAPSPAEANANEDDEAPGRVGRAGGKAATAGVTQSPASAGSLGGSRVSPRQLGVAVSPLRSVGGGAWAPWFAVEDENHSARLPAWYFLSEFGLWKRLESCGTKNRELED